MSRFLISCGGTGGHLSPGIALAEGLRVRGHDSRLLISRKQVDARLSAKYPELGFERMPGTGFNWRPVAFLRCVASQAQALWFCGRLIRRFRPHAVIGFGGFTSAPLVLAAWVLGVPAALHESNRVPGLAVRTLGRLARRVYLPPGIRIPGLGDAVTRHAGQPVRREISRRPPEAARAALGLEPRQRLLVVLGGSQGAGPLNAWVRTHQTALAAEGVQLYVVTGLGKGDETVVDTTSSSGARVRAVYVPFSDRMADLMSAADLVLSRAGAGTLAELIRCETPAILVPYPQAADDHQRANADYFAGQGGGVVVPQDRLDGLLATVLGLIVDDERLRAFRARLQQLDRASALEAMLADLENLARGETDGGGRHPAGSTPSDGPTRASLSAR
jgi:UDP-N-acetylglucosamine--N-acetylmuramyl-(pentapeptide) pyrophosphoryl-undecaprenol N-acetylglucosamine transferase